MLKITSNSVPGYPRICKRLIASGLSRVLEHMWQGPFGILSAARIKDDEDNRVSDEENYRQNGNLKNILKQLGQGWIDFGGGYMYKEKDAPDLPIKENSLFLPGISESDLKSLAIQFDQESYIFGDKGYWKMQSTNSDEIWSEGLVEDTFETFKNKEVSKEYPYMSQLGKGHQFRLDPELVQRRKQEQEQIARDQHARDHHVAFRLVGAKSPCFYSIAGQFRPRPPVCLAASNVVLSGNCPDGSLLECWLPLQEIS